MFRASNATDRVCCLRSCTVIRLLISTVLSAGYLIASDERLVSAQDVSSPPSSLVGSTLLCGGGVDPTPRILISRFSLFGDFESSLQRSVEPAFVGSLAGSLLGRQDFPGSVFVWGRDAADLSPNKEIASLIEDAFLGGMTPDHTGDRQRTDLQRALLANNCEYLFGGRLAKDANLFVVTPYLFNVARKEVLVPFAPSVVDGQAIFKVPQRFSDELASYLKKITGDQPRSRLIEVSCLYAAIPEKSERNIELLAAGLRRRLAQDLSTLGFSVRASPDGPTLCPNLSSNISPDVAASASGELNLKDNQVELRPVVKIFDYNDQRRPVLAIFLAPTTRLLTSAITLVGDYTRPIRAFLIAVTKDGVFPNFRQAILPESSDALLKFWSSTLQRGDVEQGALAAYQALSQWPDSTAANYVLGNVFYQKKQDELALEHFLTAIKGQSDLPMDLRARLNELTGLTYNQIRNQNEAIKYLDTAKILYGSLQKDADLGRTKRQLATTQFLLGRQSEAFQELLGQKELETDRPSLLLLGRLAALSDKYEEAENWLGKILKIDGNNAEARSLLAEIHGKLGRSEFGANNFAGARRYFVLSLGNREDVNLRYLSGLAAYRLDEYNAAIADFEKIINFPVDKTPLRWMEGAWLTLLECYLLSKNYDAVESSGQRAVNVIGGLMNSRMLTYYLRFVAKVLRDPFVPIEELTADPRFKELQNAAATGSTKIINWNNNKVDAFIGQAKLEPEKQQLLTEARKVVLP